MSIVNIEPFVKAQSTRVTVPRIRVKQVAVPGVQGPPGGGSLELMVPDPREYFLYILYNGTPPDIPDIPDIPDEPDIPDVPVDNAYSPKLNAGKLNYMILA